MITIEIGDKEYLVSVLKTPEEKQLGLSGKEYLPNNQGALFIFDPPQEVSFHMKDTKIPLDIIFINSDEEVISVRQGIPNDLTPIIESNVAYVLEVNQNSGIRKGDELDFEDDEDEGPVMKVLFQDGSELYPLWGGERIVSRRETKILIKKAKKADLSKEDKDYKALGKYIFKVINRQDNRDPEYVLIKN